MHRAEAHKIVQMCAMLCYLQPTLHQNINLAVILLTTQYAMSGCEQSVNVGLECSPEEAGILSQPDRLHQNILNNDSNI